MGETGGELSPAGIGTVSTRFSFYTPIKVKSHQRSLADETALLERSASYCFFVFF